MNKTYRFIVRFVSLPLVLSLILAATAITPLPLALRNEIYNTINIHSHLAHLWVDGVCVCVSVCFVFSYTPFTSSPECDFHCRRFSINFRSPYTGLDDEHWGNTHSHAIRKYFLFTFSCFRCTYGLFECAQYGNKQEREKEVFCVCDSLLHSSHVIFCMCRISLFLFLHADIILQ